MAILLQWVAKVLLQCTKSLTGRQQAGKGKGLSIKDVRTFMPIFNVCRALNMARRRSQSPQFICFDGVSNGMYNNLEVFYCLYHIAIESLHITYALVTQFV